MKKIRVSPGQFAGILKEFKLGERVEEAIGEYSISRVAVSAP